MATISKSVRKPDHDDKVSGKTRYIDDYPKAGVLYGKLIHAAYARAEIREILYPEFQDGYGKVDWRDVPGRNFVHVVENDMPLFAEHQVEYIGEPVAMIAGPCKEVVEELCGFVEILYDIQTPVIDMAESEDYFYEKEFCYGEVDQAFAEADMVMEETFYTGYQEHAYLEPQGMIAYPDGERIVLKGSLQCPYYVHAAVASVLGSTPENVRVIQSPTGGGFGGKEDYPSVVACASAVAAVKFGKPVSLIYERREDMECTSKRHPSESRYRAAVKDGRVSAMDIDVALNAGAYKTLSLIVLQRSMVCANGVYHVENLKVHGTARKTNTVPCGAFRGFGDPQVFFAVEMFMNHLAEKLGEDPWEFKRRNMVKEGDYNSTRGKFHVPVPLPDMMDRVDGLSSYREKRNVYARQTGRYRRGIGMGLHFHGTGFATTKDMAEGITVRLHKDCNGTVQVLTANTDMGQGLATAFRKIVGEVLSLPYDSIEVPEPDTDIVPNSGPTVASRSLLTVGEMVRRAAVRLKEEWRDGEDQTMEEGFLQPEGIIPYDADTFFGDPYPAYAWGAAVLELEIDTYTGMSNLLQASAVFDVGTVIDENIVRGQMEGGLLQGIGYASMEQMDADRNGRIRNNSYSDYIIPTAPDVPNIFVETFETQHLDGPFGAKGAGELPNGGITQAYTQALEQALGGYRITQIPFSAEKTLKAWEETKYE